MKKNKIYWKDAIELINKGSILNQSEIDFKNESIPIKSVGVLNQNNIRVPENLIFYDDNSLDCSDIPEITKEDIQNGNIQWINLMEFPIDKEIGLWIINHDIRLNELIPRLLNNFYQTMKSIQRNSAI